MKLTYSLLAAAFACGLASAQTTAYTTPVGYVSTLLSPNKYNLIAVTLHEPTVSAGVVTGESATDVSMTGVDFTTLLTAGSVYILELPDGTIQEISAWTATSLTTPEDISGKVTPGTTTYKLRKASTVASVFGAANSAGLTADNDDDSTNNDQILVPNTSGAFDTVYYFTGNLDAPAGWYDDQGNPADTKVLNYADGMFVQRVAGSDKTLVVAGEIKTKPTSNALLTGYNFLGAVSPVGLTLGTSGLKDFLTHAATDEDVATADKVLTQNPDGAYRTMYYFDGNLDAPAGWYDDQGNPSDDAVLDSGFLVENLGVGKNYTIAVPAAYLSL